MPTVIAFECADGAVVAADRTVVQGDTVASTDQNRLLEFDDCGGAAVDDPDTVRRKLDAELRAYEADHGGSPSFDALTAIAESVLGAVGTDAGLAAYDDEGIARVAAVYADGSVITGSPLGLGTGAEMAVGRMEAADTDVKMDEAAELAETILQGVAERDTRTGKNVDVFRLENE
jgi:proteasome beta subunit